MKFTIPWFAAGIGIVLAIVLMRGGALSAGEALSLPLLTMLFISEFGFIVTAIGGVVAGKTLLQNGRNWSNLLLTVTCISLSVAFFTIGILLWTGQVSQ